MCKFCEEDETIEEGQSEIKIDYQKDLEIKTSCGDGIIYTYLKIRYCPMCSQRL
jgi:hypothetical protein